MGFWWYYYYVRCVYTIYTILRNIYRFFTVLSNIDKDEFRSANALAQLLSETVVVVDLLIIRERFEKSKTEEYIFILCGAFIGLLGKFASRSHNWYLMRWMTNTSHLAHVTRKFCLLFKHCNNVWFRCVYKSSERQINLIVLNKEVFNVLLVSNSNIHFFFRNHYFNKLLTLKITLIKKTRTAHNIAMS